MKPVQPGSWHTTALSGYEERRFGVKVGNVLRDDFGRWIACYDGRVLGRAHDVRIAKQLVEAVAGGN